LKVHDLIKNSSFRRLGREEQNILFVKTQRRLRGERIMNKGISGERNQICELVKAGAFFLEVS
jgi:hypothetical protein